MSTPHRGSVPASPEALRAVLRRVFIGLLLTLAAALLLVLYGANQFRGLAHPEAIDQAQLARNLFRGDGFTTLFIRPLSMWQFSQHTPGRNPLLERHPDIVNPPLYPALAAGMFHLVQKGDPSPPEAVASIRQPLAPHKNLTTLEAILAWPYWHWVWLTIAVAWIIVVPLVELHRRDLSESLPIHIVGILFLLILFSMHWRTVSRSPSGSRTFNVEEAAPWDVIQRGPRPPSEEGKSPGVSAVDLSRLPPSIINQLAQSAIGQSSVSVSRRVSPVAVVLSWPYWHWVWLGLAGMTVGWVVRRWQSGRLRPTEMTWLVTAIGACLMLTVLHSLPRMSFLVEPQESFMRFGPDLCLIYGIGVPLTLLNGWLVYLVACRLFDRRTGVVAAALFVLSDAVCQYAISGLSVPLVMSWTLLAFLALLVADERREDQESLQGPLLWLLASGGLMGLAFLTKYAAGCLLLPACVLCWYRWGRRVGSLMAVSVVLGFLIVAGPWLARNVLVSGSFLGLAQYSLLEHSGVYPGDLLQRMLEPKFRLFTAQRLVTKVFNHGHQLLTDCPWVVGAGLILAGFVASLCYRFRAPRANRFKWWTLGAIGVLFVAACVIGVETRPDRSAAQSGNLPIVLLPLMAVFAAGVFHTWLDGLGLHKVRRRCLIALVGAVAALPLVLRLGATLPSRFAYPPCHPPTLHRIASYLEPNEFMTSDLPWAVAWYGDRRCIWLPFTPGEFYQINDHHQHISAMLATPVTLNARYLTEVTLGEWAPWASILGYLHFPSHFPLQIGYLVVGMNLSAVEWDLYHTLDLEKVIGGVHMVLLCDRKRWDK